MTARQLIQLPLLESRGAPIRQASRSCSHAALTAVTALEDTGSNHVQETTTACMNVGVDLAVAAVMCC